MGATSRAIKKSREFNPSTFLATIGEGRKNLTFAQKQGMGSATALTDYPGGTEGGLQVHSSLLGIVLHD